MLHIFYAPAQPFFHQKCRKLHRDECQSSRFTRPKKRVENFLHQNSHQNFSVINFPGSHHQYQKLSLRGWNEVTRNPAEGSVEPLKLSKVSTKRSKIKAAIKLVKYVITLPFNFLFISLSLGVFAQARRGTLWVVM